jgi:integrase
MALKAPVAESTEGVAQEHQARAKAKKTTLTELGLRRLKPPKEGQRLYWDTGSKGQLGLSVLVSAGGTKTYRSTFYLHGKRIDRKLGRVGEMDLTQARELTRGDRKQAAEGNDPRQPARQDKQSLGYVVEEFIEHYAKPRQRTWDQTANILRNNCRPLLAKPMESITKQEVRDLLHGFIADGHPYKAGVTYRWLKKLWRWAAQWDYVTSPMMEAVSIEYEKRERDRVYSDAEIKSCWHAADQLNPVEGAYIKLLILLAPRKTALACMCRSHLDDADNPTLWTTPHELTKSKKSSAKKREYKTPLPPLAQRILKGLTRNDSNLLFPGLTVCTTMGGRPRFLGNRVTQRLVEHGAPADFAYHAWRHTLATFLEDAGHSEWERGLVLNHSSDGVTAGYSHGHPLDLKRKLLGDWADHVEALVSPQGAALLR